MKLDKLFMLGMILAMVMSLSFVIACGDDDDDDDDDSSSDDDDDDDDSGDDDFTSAEDAISACVDFYVNCAGLDEATAETSCAYLSDYDYTNECIRNAVGNLFDCLNAACESLQYQDCLSNYYDEVMDCI